MKFARRGLSRKRERTGTPARRSTTDPASIAAASIHVYGAASGRRVSGPALAELLSLGGRH